MLLVFSVLRRRCCWWPLGRRRRCLSIYHAHTALSSKPAARRGCRGRMTGQTDRLMDARPLHIPCCAYYAGSANDQLAVVFIIINTMDTFKVA